MTPPRRLAGVLALAAGLCACGAPAPDRSPPGGAVPSPAAQAAFDAARARGRPLLAIVRPPTAFEDDDRGRWLTALVRSPVAAVCLAMVHAVVLPPADVGALAPGAVVAPVPLAVLIETDGGTPAWCVVPVPGAPGFVRSPPIDVVEGDRTRVRIAPPGDPERAPPDPGLPFAFALRLAVLPDRDTRARRAAQAAAGFDAGELERALRSARSRIRLSPETRLRLAAVLCHEVARDPVAGRMVREDVAEAVARAWDASPPAGLAWVDVDREEGATRAADPSGAWCGTPTFGAYGDARDAGPTLRFTRPTR